MCNCQGKTYNIAMCCEPQVVLGPVENYYTKPTIDRMLEEKIPTSNTAFTNDAGYLTEHQHIKTINGLSLIGDGNIEIGTGGTIDLSNYYTTAQTDSLIESAVTRVEGEIPTIPTSNTAFTNDAGYLTQHQSLSGYATQQWVRDQHYITGVDLSNYATKAEIPVVPTSNTAFTNDAGYLTEHQSLSGYATTAFVSAFTYDKATIDEKVAEGGSFDPSQYYNKTATDALLDEKLYVTAYTPTDLSNYYTKTEVDNEIISAITDVEAEIPTVPTSNTAFTNDAGYLTEHQSLSGYATEQWVEDKHYITGVDLSNYATKAEIPTVPTDISAFNNDVGYITGVDLSNYATKAEIPVVPTSNTAFTNDAGYITGVDLSNYATKDNLTAATDDMATQTWVNNQGYLTEHQSLTAYSTTQEVNTMINQSVSGKQDTLSAGTNITIVDNVISAQGGGTDAPISAGTGTEALIENNTSNVASGNYSHAEGSMTKATGNTSHAEGHNAKAYGQYSHTEGDATTASGEDSHAEGYNTMASGKYSHAEGSHTTANTLYAHAEGYYTLANGNSSHAEGCMTTTNNKAEHASGQYNVSSSGSSTFGDSGNTLFSVGNGTGSNTRHNAFEVRQNGDIYIQSGNTDIKLQDHLDGVTYTAGTGIDITNNVISSVIKFWCGTMAEYEQISGSTDNNTIYLIHS